MIDTGSLLMPISRPGLFTFYIKGCYSSVFFNRLVKILSQDPLDF